MARQTLWKQIGCAVSAGTLALATGCAADVPTLTRALSSSPTTASSSTPIALLKGCSSLRPGRAAYQRAAAQLDSGGNVDALLSAFAPMLPAETKFFDHVLVNTGDNALRRNRLGLLQAISAMRHGRADLSQLSEF